MLSGLTKALNQMNTQVLVRRKQTQRKSQSVKDGREKQGCSIWIIQEDHGVRFCSILKLLHIQD